MKSEKVLKQKATKSFSTFENDEWNWNDWFLASDASWVIFNEFKIFIISFFM